LTNVRGNMPDFSKVLTHNFNTVGHDRGGVMLKIVLVKTSVIVFRQTKLWMVVAEVFQGIIWSC